MLTEFSSQIYHDHSLNSDYFYQLRLKLTLHSQLNLSWYMIGCMSSPSGIMHFDPWYFFSRSTFDSIDLKTYFLLFEGYRYIFNLQISMCGYVFKTIWFDLDFIFFHQLFIGSCFQLPIRRFMARNFCEFWRTSSPGISINDQKHLVQILEFK